MPSDEPVHWQYPGARWWKFDLHTHTPASVDTPWRGENELSPEDWLTRYMQAGIDCVAITDHNSGAWVDKVKETYARMRRDDPYGTREIHLFPGLEISVNGGFHLLAILDKSGTTADIDTLLGRVDYRGKKGSSDDVTHKSPIEVVEAVLDVGGIPIPAHVDGPKGLLRATDDVSTSSELDSNTIRQVLGQTGILALEVMDRSWCKPALYRDMGMSHSEVIGSDCHSFRGTNKPGSRFTWVKMADPTLEGLRLALVDGAGFSIRRSDDCESFDPFLLPENLVEAVEIKNARFMGRPKSLTFTFSPWLNVLVGGRGTGKSTVIHALRLVSRRDRELENFEPNSEPRLTFERFNRVPSGRNDTGGFTESAAITWFMLRANVRYRVGWSQENSEQMVDEDDGQGGWTPSAIQTIPPERFPIRIFSQGQIAALAGQNQQALLEVIDEAAQVQGLKRDWHEAQSEFYSLRARVRELEDRLGSRDDLAIAYQDVERKLRRFEESGHTEILTSYRHRSRQQREVDRHFGTVEGMADRLDDVSSALQSEDLPEELFDTNSREDQELAERLEALADAVRAATLSVRDNAKRLREILAAERIRVSEGNWQKTMTRARNDYEQLVERLHEEGVHDPSEYGQLVQERQRLESEIKLLDSLQEERERLSLTSQLQLQKVLRARRAISDGRDAFLTNTLSNNPFVRIETRPYGNDPRVMERSLRDVLDIIDDHRFQDDILVIEGGQPIRGIVAELLADLQDDSCSRRLEIERRLHKLKQRINDACGGEGNFGGYFNNYLEREAGRSPELLDKLLVWFPEDTLSVEYSRHGDGTDFQSIGQASAGQRSAAMLAFLLAHGEEPLVLDQPEDDLDNHLIYDLVVRQMRENKLRRQIIVVTHNPNIVVNGDAEMLYALDFRGGQCMVVESGSLQEQDMREEVCRVMEGGREAFERRYRRLGPGSVDV